MTELQVRFATFVVLAIGAGGITADLVRGFLDDYGWPWARRAGTNGRWRTDALVIVLFFLLAAISVTALFAIVFAGWQGARIVTTAMVAGLAASAVGAWLSGKVERRVRREIGNEAAVRTEVAAAQTMAAAERATVAADDTRRSAHRTEEAAEKVIERMDAE